MMDIRAHVISTAFNCIKRHLREDGRSYLSIIESNYHHVEGLIKLEEFADMVVAKVEEFLK